jgi:hypothetical protein
MNILSDDPKEGVTLYDPLTLDCSSFSWINGYYPHKVTKVEISKPYLISYAYYGTVDYEDLILLLNNVTNPFEMVPGKELRIPKLEDLQSFILTNKK